jgi:hypothetical protein
LTVSGTYLSGTVCTLECDAGFNQVGELLCENGAWIGEFACTAEPVCPRPDASAATCPSFTYTKLSGLDVRDRAALQAAFLTDHSYTDDCKVAKQAGSDDFALASPCAPSVKERYLMATPWVANADVFIDFKKQSVVVESIVGATLLSNVAGLVTIRLGAVGPRVTLRLSGAIPRPVLRCAQAGLFPRVNGVVGKGKCANFLIPRGSKCKATFDKSQLWCARARRERCGARREARAGASARAWERSAAGCAQNPRSRACPPLAPAPAYPQSGAREASSAATMASGGPTPTTRRPRRSAEATRSTRRPCCSPSPITSRAPASASFGRCRPTTARRARPSRVLNSPSPSAAVTPTSRARPTWAKSRPPRASSASALR